MSARLRLQAPKFERQLSLSVCPTLKEYSAPSTRGANSLVRELSFVSLGRWIRVACW